MNDLELLDHLFEEHSCDNCSLGYWCEDHSGVCEKWQVSSGNKFADYVEKIQNKINKNIKRGAASWIA